MKPGQASLELLAVILILVLLLASGLAFFAGMATVTVKRPLEAMAFVLERGANLGLPFETNYTAERLEIVDFRMRRGDETAFVTSIREGTMEGNRYETYKRLG